MSIKLKFWLLSISLLLPCVSAVAEDKDGFADSFHVNPQDFVSTGGNDYFSLKPGYKLTLEGTDHGKPARLVITVLDETKTIDGVETRIVEERETVGDQLIEVSRNYFAADKNTNDVYYFGEDVDTYENGKVNGHPGAWQSGKNGAHYGLMMPAKPRVGQKFYQEVAPGVAMDRCEVVSVDEEMTVPAGSFEHVVKMKESTPLERGTEYKPYAPKAGLLADEDLKLVKHGTPAQ